MDHVSRVRLSPPHGFHRDALSRILGICIAAVTCWGVDAATLSASTYYVAPSGSDTNAGTLEAPWKTIGKAFGTAKAGDTVLIRGGVYQESITVTNNGTSGSPITFKNYPNESPIIEGSLPVTGWTVCQAGDSGLTVKGTTNPHYGSIYVATVSKSVANSAVELVLYENHDRLQLACDPAHSNPIYDEVSEFRALSNEGGNWGQAAYLVDTDFLTQSDDYWNGAGVRVWSHNASNWVLSTTVGDFIRSQHKIVFGTALPNTLGEGSQPDAYLLVNHPMILDQPGEYYVKADGTNYRIYLWPRSTAHLAGGISVLDNQKPSAVFLASNTAYGNYLTIDGLTIRNSKTAFEWVRWNGSSTFKGLTIKNCTIQSISGSGFYMQYHDGTIVDHCQITNVTGDYGIMFGLSSNVIIRNNILDMIEKTAIYFGGNHVSQIVKNRVGNTGTHGNGITTYDQCADILIANNVVTTPRVCITLQNSSNLTYFNNILYNSGGGAKIANWGGITGRVVVANNVMLGGSGLWGDVSGHERLVFNNILEGTTFNATTHNNNIFVSASPAPYNSKETLETSLTKLFVDPANRNYHLAANSPARGFGTNVMSYLPTSTFPSFDFALDAAGTTRTGTPDAGAYQDSSTGSAHAPVLNAIGDKTVAAGSTLSIALGATDADGGTLSYHAYALPTGATLSGQTFAWTPTSAQAGTYDVTFEVSDSQLDDSEVVTITVTAPPANRVPVLQTISNRTVAENAALTLTLQATDGDGDAITYSASGLPSGASLSGSTFSWTPTYSQAGNYTVTFSASDGESQDTQAVTIRVTNVNRPPHLTRVGIQAVAAGTALSLELSATDADGDALTYTATPIPTGAGLSGATLSWTPSASQVGLYDVTFTVSDGQDQDTSAGVIVVTSSASDATPPQVTKQSPAAGDIQVPRNHIITLSLADLGQGIDPASVVIRVSDTIVYQGDVATYDSATGRAQRSGMKNLYRYMYQANDPMFFDETVTVQVAASDRAGNPMTTSTYTFVTEMLAFADGQALSTATGVRPDSKPATVSNGHGIIWAIWQAGAEGQRHLYTACLPVGADTFRTPVRVTGYDSDQCNPDIACGADGRLYAVWQDNQRGNWDIYLSISSDGSTWSQPVRVSNSDKNETRPALVVDRDTPSHVYVVWEDDRNGNSDIYLADSSDGFTQKTTTQVTTHTAAQLDPDIALNGNGTIVVVWTDARNGEADIHGASSDQSWANVPLVTRTGVQTAPALAGAISGTTMHLLWVDQASGDSDVYYASFDGMPGTPLTGVAVADDTSGAEQVAPALLCTSDAKVFACWQDARHAAQHRGDTDLFVSEVTSGTPKTNVVVPDDDTNSAQSDPAVGVDAYGNLYVVWTDARRGQSEIYYAATTFANPDPVNSVLVDAATGGTVGTDPAAIASLDDVSIVVPANACPDSVQFTIAKIVNPKASASTTLGSYDFGPSGLTFDEPVTITIPYRVVSDAGSIKPYWYDALTGGFSQQGITDIRDVTISSTLHALQFKTTHFTPYYVLSGDAVVAADSSSGGGGGCSLSATRTGSPAELIVPFLLVALAIGAMRKWDARERSDDRT